MTQESGTQRSQSGFVVKPVYHPDDVADGLADRLGEPGDFPFTRGVYPTMYTRRPWTMRQYAGFGTALESNARYHQLLAAGQTGLSVAFDLPTQMGYDSDEPIAHGEVGKVGVAIDSIEDMRTLFDAIPLGEVSTSMTINAPAALLLLLYQLVGEQQGVPGSKLTGTIQNDVLKEYIARGTYIYPPAHSLRLTSDIFAYCQAEIPRWNTISISGYHMAEAGANPAQEIGFTLANGVEYVQAALNAGMAVDDFAPRLSFFFVSRTTLLEEVAKFRAARRIWARMMKERFGAQNPKSLMLRFHTQTAGVQLTAQQPEVNLIRVTTQAIAAIFGGTQSLHTNSYDEAIALPTEKAARLALRTQQVLAYETDLTSTVDPFAGSYAMEAMTDEVEDAAMALIEKVDSLGGAVHAIEQGFQKSEIERTAYDTANEIDSGERVVVGLNRYRLDVEDPYQPLRVDPTI
ncbi:MAG: acyl-CoA mutase large subunit family protein, partial [Pseudonocardiaceae bacterium]